MDPVFYFVQFGRSSLLELLRGNREQSLCNKVTADTSPGALKYLSVK